MTVEISLDTLVRIVVKEVLAELAKRGIEIGIPPAGGGAALEGDQGAAVAMDMTGYRTPVLTESRVRALEPHVREIIVPAGTICTMGARDVLQQRRMKLTFTCTTH